jgi:hypothetical protein
VVAGVKELSCIRNFFINLPEAGSRFEKIWQIPVMTLLYHQRRGLQQQTLWEHSGNFSGNKSGRIAGGDRGKRNVQDKKESEMRSTYELYLVSLYKGHCFEKYHTLQHYCTTCEEQM